MIKQEIQLDFNDVNQDILLFCAFRYALGRMTYVVGSIVDIIIANWDQMSSSRRKMYKIEIREAITNNKCGMNCDIKDWERVLALED